MLLSYIKSDYLKHKKYGGNLITILFLTQGFWASFQYRIAHSVFNLKMPIVKQILMIICLLWQKMIEITTGISIPASTEIGHSLYIGHFGSIIINANVLIGDNCNISQGVTIGVSGRGEKRGVPTLGNNIYVGANAVIAGKINVKNNVLVAACSLLVEDADENGVYCGVPAKKISEKSSEGYI